MISTIRPDTRSLDRHLVLVLHNFVIPKRSFQLKEKSTFRAKALRRELIVTATRRPLLETSIFPLSSQVVRELLPFAYH